MLLVIFEHLSTPFLSLFLLLKSPRHQLDMSCTPFLVPRLFSVKGLVGASFLSSAFPPHLPEICPPYPHARSPFAQPWSQVVVPVSVSSSAASDPVRWEGGRPCFPSLCRPDGDSSSCGQRSKSLHRRTAKRSSRQRRQALLGCRRQDYSVSLVSERFFRSVRRRCCALAPYHSASPHRGILLCARARDMSHFTRADLSMSVDSRLQGDVTKKDDLKRIVDQIKKEDEGIHILVNNVRARCQTTLPSWCLVTKWPPHRLALSEK